MDKPTSSKKSLSRHPSQHHRNHTSSINIKLSQPNDLSHLEHLKLPLKTILRDKQESQNRMPSKKYSGKGSSIYQDKENPVKRSVLQDQLMMKPFQDSNRYLETERVSKEHSNYKHHERSLSKQMLKIKPDHAYEQHKLRTEYV